MMDAIKRIGSRLLCCLGIHVGPMVVKEELVEESASGYFCAVDVLKRHPAGAAIRKSNVVAGKLAPRTYVEWLACEQCGRDRR